MMYLLEPDLAMWWSRQPAGLWLATARSSGYDLAQIDDWIPAERRADAVLVRLAMRHGVPCGRGLVLDGGLVSLCWSGRSPTPGHGVGQPARAVAPEPVDPREKLARSLDAVRRQAGLEPATPEPTAQETTAPEPTRLQLIQPDSAGPQPTAPGAEHRATDPELGAALAAPTDAGVVRAWVALGGSPPDPL